MRTLTPEAYVASWHGGLITTVELFAALGGQVRDHGPSQIAAVVPDELVMPFIRELRSWLTAGSVSLGSAGEPMSPAPTYDELAALPTSTTGCRTVRNRRWDEEAGGAMADSQDYEALRQRVLQHAGFVDPVEEGVMRSLRPLDHARWEREMTDLVQATQLIVTCVQSPPCDAELACSLLHLVVMIERTGLSPKGPLQRNGLLDPRSTAVLRTLYGRFTSAACLVVNADVDRSLIRFDD